ncbi:MAG: hypothetical protein PHZ00_03870 [Candidatus Peribacteraceae bacterium]|nr:hypothetical protein [Candidatus Peribacteraceae bacterium]
MLIKSLFNFDKNISLNNKLKHFNKIRITCVHKMIDMEPVKFIENLKKIFPKYRKLCIEISGKLKAAKLILDQINPEIVRQLAHGKTIIDCANSEDFQALQAIMKQFNTKEIKIEKLPILLIGYYNRAGGCDIFR